MRRIPAPEVAPGICFVCEQSHAEGLDWVDTLREFDTAIVTPLSGRKVLCSRCIVAAGAEIGLRPTDAVEAALLRAEQAERALVELRAHVAAVAEQLSVEAVALAEGSAQLSLEVVEAARDAAERLPKLPVEKPARKRSE